MNDPTEPAHAPQPDGLLDAQGLAAYLKVRPQTVLAWRTRGRGPRAIKLHGHALRWRRADVDEWLEQHAEPARVPVSA